MKYSTKAISPQVRLAMLMMERGSSVNRPGFPGGSNS